MLSPDGRTLSAVGDSNAMRIAYRLSAAAIVLMAVTAAIGAMVRGFYPEIPWAAEALRGGDVVTLVVAVPALTVAVLTARAGSRRARLLPGPLSPARRRRCPGR